MQLLIVDIQSTYEKYIPKEVINSLPDYAKEFNEVLYLWDNISDQDFYSEVPQVWLEDYPDFYDRLNAFSKNYAFLRGFMDKGVTDEDIISLAQWMLSKGLGDGRDISQDEDLEREYQEKFKNTTFYHLSFEDYTFYLPMDLIEEIKDKVKQGVILVGGGINECLKEVSLLLSILEINHTINYEFTY